MLIIGIITKILIKMTTISKNSSQELFTRLIIGVLIYSIILSYQTYEISNFTGDLPILGGLFHTNNLINGIEIYIYILSIGLIMFTISRKELIAEYRIILGFSILGMIILIESYDLISTFLAIELQSLSMYVIASISKKESSAGLKYFLLGSLSSAIFLFGVILIYSLTGITQYDGFNILYSINSIESDINILNYCQLLGDSFGNLILGGIILITIGLLFKIGAAPFHSWAPDVYDNVPTIITSWLAVMGKISILAFILIIKTTGDFGYQLESFTLLTLSIILSLLIGSILGLVQSKIKRLLAYSSISHLGFMLIGLSIDNGLAISSFLFYMFQYWLGLIGIFAILIYHNSELKSISSLQFLKLNPAITFALGVGFFSLTGIPPLIGFFGKQMILYISLLNGYFLIATIAICTSVISAAYYLRIVKTISFTEENKNVQLSSNNQQPLSSGNSFFSLKALDSLGENLTNFEKKENLKEFNSNRALSWIISIITLITLLFGINTGIVLDLTHNFALFHLYIFFGPIWVYKRSEWDRIS